MTQYLSRDSHQASSEEASPMRKKAAPGAAHHLARTARDAAKRLAALGGTQRELPDVPRRRLLPRDQRAATSPVS